MFLLVIFFSITTPNFRTLGNFMIILRQVSITGILAVGMTFVLLTAGIDLSVGSQVGFVGMISSIMMVNLHIPLFFSFLIGILTGCVVGFLNGVLITRTKMPPLIETLGMTNIVLGLNYIITGGLPISGLPKGMRYIGQGFVGPVPIPVIILILVFILGGLVLTKTYFGRYVYAVGSNAEAARLTGLNTDKICLSVYILQGALCGLAGLIMLSRVGSGQPISGKGLEMDVITACIVGGVSITGGEGKITGVVFGVLIMGIMSNGMAVMGLGEYYQTLMKGLVLVVAIGIDCYQNLLASKKKRTSLEG
jgi:ribose/xylose/arabinose/galactoside ABC-type transport system permease subunit